MTYRPICLEVFKLRLSILCAKFKNKCPVVTYTLHHSRLRGDLVILSRPLITYVDALVTEFLILLDPVADKEKLFEYRGIDSFKSLFFSGIIIARKPNLNFNFKKYIEAKPRKANKLDQKLEEILKIRNMSTYQCS